MPCLNMVPIGAYPHRLRLNLTDLLDIQDNRFLPQGYRVHTSPSRLDLRLLGEC